MYRLKLIIVVVVGCSYIIAAGLAAQDLYFREVGRFFYPNEFHYTEQYQVLDFDGDGLDEVFYVTAGHITINSFVTSTAIVTIPSETGLHGISGAVAVQYDADEPLEILAVDNWGRNLYIVDDYDTGTFELLTPINMTHYGWDAPANILCMDAEEDGEKDIVISWLGVYDGGPCGMMDWTYNHGGDAVSLNSADWTENWSMYSEHWGDYLPDHSSGQNAAILSSPNDDEELIVMWGPRWHEYCIHDPGWEKVRRIRYQFRVYSGDGTTLFSWDTPVITEPLWRDSTDLYVAIGNINPATVGDDVILWINGPSPDTGVFVPSGQAGTYCLSMVGDTAKVVWGAEATESQRFMFSLPSMSGTFCSSIGRRDFQIRSGSDGSVLGTIHGLRPTSNTTEGRFLPLPDSVLQVVQVIDDDIYLYILDSSIAVGVEDSPPLPNSFSLAQNFPNPFNPSTSIQYYLPRRSHVKLTVHNLLGQKIATLVDESQAFGPQAVEWDGNDAQGNPVASGVYLYRIKADGFTQSRKMVLLK